MQFFQDLFPNICKALISAWGVCLIGQAYTHASEFFFTLAFNLTWRLKNKIITK